MARTPRPDLDEVFAALSDPTRRSILERLGGREAAVSELAKPHAMSLPAVSKHLRVLENAGLVQRRVEGRQHFLRVNPDPFERAQQWIEQQSQFWQGSFDRLAKHLSSVTDSNQNPVKSPKP